jgi:hypothetical protein
MSLVLHGVAGGWDELIIAVTAFGVLFLAVKLAGRGRHDEVEPEEGLEPTASGQDGEANKDPLPPPPAVKRG